MLDDAHSESRTRSTWCATVVMGDKSDWWWQDPSNGRGSYSCSDVEKNLWSWIRGYQIHFMTGSAVISSCQDAKWKGQESLGRSASMSVYIFWPLSILHFKHLSLREWTDSPDEEEEDFLTPTMVKGHIYTTRPWRSLTTFYWILLMLEEEWIERSANLTHDHGLKCLPIGS